MIDFIDVQDIAIRNRIAVNGRVNPTVEDWNNLLTHIDRTEQENAELREALRNLSEKFEHSITCQGRNPESWSAYRKANQLLNK